MTGASDDLRARLLAIVNRALAEAARREGAEAHAGEVTAPRSEPPMLAPPRAREAKPLRYRSMKHWLDDGEDE